MFEPITAKFFLVVIRVRFIEELHCNILVPDGVYSRIEGQGQFRNIETIVSTTLAGIFSDSTTC